LHAFEEQRASSRERAAAEVAPGLLPAEGGFARRRAFSGVRRLVVHKLSVLIDGDAEAPSELAFCG
jgi:hypothetical protein